MNEATSDQRLLNELIERPSESLAVEIKNWIRPGESAGAAKIVKAALALRNYGGGYLLIGFNDESLEPDQANVPEDIRQTYHQDVVQGLVTKHASEPFEVAVDFVPRGDYLHPVIVVPAGVRTPVASKADLYDEARKRLIAVDDVYVRTLLANNTPSSAKASWKDWSRLAEVCFDNREADVGRFFRRHLSAITPDMVSSLLSSLGEPTQVPTLDERVRELLDAGKERFDVATIGKDLPKHGSWEVACVINGDVPTHHATRDFLRLLDQNNPQYTGWPIWLDSTQFQDRESRPRVNHGAWETLVVTDPSVDPFGHIDFMIVDPSGKFYLRRALEDDINGGPNRPKVGVALDFGLPIIRVAESIAVGLAFARSMGCSIDTTLGFGFRWVGLRDRMLSSWAQPARFIPPGRQAYQDEVIEIVHVPLDLPLSALPTYVEAIVKPLFAVFDGFDISRNVIADLVERLISRRL